MSNDFSKASAPCQQAIQSSMSCVGKDQPQQACTKCSQAVLEVQQKCTAEDHKDPRIGAMATYCIQKQDGSYCGPNDSKESCGTCQKQLFQYFHQKGILSDIMATVPADKTDVKQCMQSVTGTVGPAAPESGTSTLSYAPSMTPIILLLLLNHFFYVYN